MAAPEIAATRAPQAVVESEEFPGLAGLDAIKLARAETAIRSCLAGETSDLALGCLELVTLPGPTIGRIKHLRVLRCGFNRLTELPPELGKCAELQIIFCSFNRLTNLPSKLGKCVELRSISCTTNRIEALPAEIGELVELTGLYCTDNRLAILPPELGNLPKLQELDCRWNPLAKGTPQTLEELRAQWAVRPHTKSAARL